MREVYRAGDITEAHIVAGMLGARGIEAEVSGFFLQGGIGELASQDFARVLVDEEDWAGARAVVAEYESADRDAAPVVRAGGDAASSPGVVPESPLSPLWIMALIFLASFALAYLLRV